MGESYLCHLMGTLTSSALKNPPPSVVPFKEKNNGNTWIIRSINDSISIGCMCFSNYSHTIHNNTYIIAFRAMLILHLDLSAGCSAMMASHVLDHFVAMVWNVCIMVIKSYRRSSTIYYCKDQQLHSFRRSCESGYSCWKILKQNRWTGAL